MDEFFAQDIQGFLSVVRRKYPKSFSPQNLGQGIAERLMIIHQQNVLWFRNIHFFLPDASS
jgi:hypothetical protein